MSDYSINIVTAVKLFLEEDECSFTFKEETGIFKFGLPAIGMIKRLDYQIRVHEDYYILYAVSPLSADREDGERMMKLAEFFCRVNYGLRNGNFEFDFRDGEIRYKSFVDCDGGVVPTKEIINNSIYLPAAMFSRYSKGITGVMFGELSPKEAVQKCEDDSNN